MKIKLKEVELKNHAVKRGFNKILHPRLRLRHDID